MTPLIAVVQPCLIRAPCMYVLATAKEVHNIPQYVSRGLSGGVDVAPVPVEQREI